MQERARALTEIWKPFGIEIVKLSHGLRCFAIWKPGERLGETTFIDLYDILEELWRHVTGQDMARFWRKKKNAGFLEKLDELYLAVNARDQIVGFNGWFLAGSTDYINICVDLIGLLPQWKQTPDHTQKEINFGPEFLQKTIIERAYKRYEDWVEKPIYVTTRTQSPVVYLLAQNIVATGSLYPDPSGKVPPGDVLACAQAYAEKLGIRRETMTVSGRRQPKEIGEDLIWRNAYNPPLYQRDPNEPAANEIDDFFRKKLGERDAFILVGRPKTAAEADPGTVAKATT